ncbi:hypothetical protein Tco_1077471 [Tanacetum coccineum]
MKKVGRGITMINHTQAEAMGILTNVLCQVGVTTLIAKFLILDIPIDRDSLILVGRGFLRTIGGIVNTPEILFSTFDKFCHRTFREARSDVMRNAKSDSDEEEEHEIKRNKFGPKPAPYLNCNDPAERSLAIQPVTNPFRKISIWKKVISFPGSLPVSLKHVNWKPDYKGSYTKEEEATGQLWEETMLKPDHLEPNALDNMKQWNRMYLMGCDGEIDDMLRIKLREAESNEEIFTSVAWIRAFNIKQPIYAELCNEFYSTYKFDEVCDDDELQSKKIIKFRLGGSAHNLTLLEFGRRLGLYHADELEDDGFDVYFQGGLLSDDQFNVQDYWLSISIEENLGLSRSHASTIKNLILRVIHKMITYDLCQRTTRLYMTTLREWIDSEGRLIPVDPQSGVPRVGIPRPPRASMQDLYDRMGSMEIRHEAIERMEYRQSYH